jgi:hypothetical protein
MNIHKHTPEQKKLVREMLAEISKIPDNDEQTSIKALIALLNRLLRTKNLVPPTVELMCHIKQTKPELYHATRMSITSTSNLNLLFQLDADPELANARLREYLED